MFGACPQAEASGRFENLVGGTDPGEWLRVVVAPCDIGVDVFFQLPYVGVDAMSDRPFGDFCEEALPLA
jgi:hypothetical protein